MGNLQAGEVGAAQAIAGGFVGVRQAARAVAEQGGAHGPVSLPKAWKEMVHRYLAGFLGLLILAIAVIAWMRRAAAAEARRRSIRAARSASVTRSARPL